MRRDEVAKLRTKEVDKRAKVAAIFEEETWAKRKAIKKKKVEEEPVLVEEEAVEVNSKRTTSASFDIALEEAFE